MLAWISLAAVIALLLLGIRQQFAVLSPRTWLLNDLAILPQWKFFGQMRIADDPAIFDDLHLIARQAGGEWRELLWWEDRPWHETFWKPEDRWQFFIGQHMANLVESERNNEQAAELTALAYLTVLRFCLDHLTPPDGESVQFAITTTKGRRNRTLALGFVSGWHLA
jgi:hypothetical protein